MSLSIAVVGFGVAGATAALTLSAQGHQVTLLEQAPSVSPVGAGVLLQLSGQGVLRALRLLDQVVARAEPILRVHARTHGGRTLVDLRYADLRPGCQAYGLHRGDLFSALQRAVAERPIALRLGCRVQGLRRVQDGGAVLLDDEAGQEHGPFDLVVVSDGSRSRLRAQSGVSHRATPYPHGALWALGRSHAAGQRLLQVTRGTQRLCGLLPMGEGRCSLFWLLHQDEHPRLLDAGLAAFRAQVLALCPEAEELLAGLTSLEALTFTRYQHVRLPRLYHHRCVFLGDAAHAMSPHLGQGINLALLDAYLFAAALAAERGPAPSDEADRAAVPRALLRYQRERSGQLRFYSRLTQLLTPFFQSQGRALGWLRDRFLPLLPRVPPLRQQMLLSVAGVKGGWLAGPLTLPGPELFPLLPSLPLLTD